MNMTEQDSNRPAFGLLLDTNVVVNAAFIPNSFSDHCVRLALNAGYGLVVSDAIDTEIVKTVTNAATTDELQARAMRRMFDFMDQVLSDKIVVDDGTPVPPQIPKTDGHVYQAAVQSGLAVLTADAALWLALRETGVQCFLPLEFIRLLDGMALANTIFGVTPRSESGSLFVRAYPGQWANPASSGKFTLVHSFSGVWLYYDAGLGCWVCAINGLHEPLRVRGEVQAQKLSTVTLSWGGNDRERVVSLKAADSIEPCRVPFDSELGSVNLFQARVGSTLYGQHYWNGTIYCCVSDDRPIGPKSWRKYLRHRDLAPNPFDADRLAYAINHPE